MGRGFYSVVQYCPDRFRAEAVNVGLVLLCLEPHAVRARMITHYGRVRKLFGIEGADLQNLKFATRGMKNRIEAASGEIRTAEELEAFAGSRANDLRLTTPRLAKVEAFDEDFARLFSELVEGLDTASRADRSPTEILPPKLNEVFYRLQQEHKIWKPGTIEVPVFKRRLEIPYAYRNGVVNLIKPHVFSPTRQSETQAANLALNGDLIQKHPIDGEHQKLIVVSAQESAEQAREIDAHIQPLFDEYRVRLIRPDGIEAFAEEVERSAH